MKKKTGIGLIGCGGRLRGLAAGILSVNDRIEVRALCDPNPDAIAATREICRAPEAKVYDDHRALSRDPDIKWVLVGSWNALHRKHVVAAFRAGKHVFCEKPLATNLTDCLAMRKAWLESGRQFSIGFTLRYSPHYQQIEKLVRRGAIGQIVSMEFNETIDFNHGGFIHADWRRHREHAGTHLLEKCCHDVDLVNWIVDSTAQRVASFGGLNFFRPENARHIRRIGKHPEGGHTPYMAWPMPEPLNPFTTEKSIVDNQVAIIEFASGARATFHTNCNAGIPERRMYILGTTGAIRADVLTGQVQMRKIGWDTPFEDVSTEGVGGHGGGDESLVEELGASIVRGRKPRTGLDDGLRASITCFGIDKAMDTGRVVNMAPMWKRADIEA